MASRRRNRIVTFLASAFLPMVMVPFVAFGLFALKTHHQALQSQNLDHMRARLDGMRHSLGVLLETVRTQAALLPAPRSLVDLDDELRSHVVHWRRVTPAVARVFWVDDRRGLKFVEPSQPAEQALAMAEIDLGSFGDRDGAVRFQGVFANEQGVAHVQIVRRVQTSLMSGYLVVDVSLGGWLKASGLLPSAREKALVALIPYGTHRKDANALALGPHPSAEFWFQIQELRSKSLSSRVIELKDGAYYVAVDDLAIVQSRLILAQPVRQALLSVERVAWSFAALAVLVLTALALMILLGVRWTERFLRELSSGALAVAKGDFEAHVAARGPLELCELADAFNAMTDALRVEQRRMRVQHKAVVELSSCQDADRLVRKLVELAATQCRGDTAWFEPLAAGGEPSHRRRTDGVRAWVWRQHRSFELALSQEKNVWQRSDGDRVFGFTVRRQNHELGTLKVGYRQAPDDDTVSLLHAVVSLAETVLQRQETMRHGALETVEVALANVMQQSLGAEAVRKRQGTRLAYHHQPAMRLGGDWLFLMEDQTQDGLYIITGDVTGQGLARGVVATAVKGALEVLAQLVQSPAGPRIGPLAIVSYLERVIACFASQSQVTMSCSAVRVDFATLQLRVCNAGHSSPIVVGVVGDQAVRQLSELVQPPLGSKESAHVYEEASYELDEGDLLVVYADGMSKTKNLKSHIFGRFLMQSLRKKSDYGSARALRDELLHMFQYYTQETPVDDDVYFLVVEAVRSDPKTERERLQPA